MENNVVQADAFWSLPFWYSFGIFEWKLNFQSCVHPHVASKLTGSKNLHGKFPDIFPIFFLANMVLNAEIFWTVYFWNQYLYFWTKKLFFWKHAMKVVLELYLSTFGPFYLVEISLAEQILVR